MSLSTGTALLDPLGRFHVYRHDRPGIHYGGGVCIFVSNKIVSHSIDINRDEFGCADITSCALILGTLHLSLHCVYIPPNMSIDDFRTNLGCLQCLCASDGSQDLLVGHFNLPHID